jgi:hypothetical protein
MCKDAGLPVVWNVHARIPRDMKGPLFLLSKFQPDSVDALFSKLQQSLMGLGVPEEHISLEATEAPFPFAFNYAPFKKLLTEVHLLVAVVDSPQQPPASPVMQPPPPSPPFQHQPYPQLPYAHAIPLPQSQSPQHSRSPMPMQPHPPPPMQPPPQHFMPVTPPRAPSAASSTSTPSPTPTVLAIEGRVSALETQLRSVDAKLDRLLAFMAPAEAPPAQRQRTS